MARGISFAKEAKLTVWCRCLKIYYCGYTIIVLVTINYTILVNDIMYTVSKGCSHVSMDIAINNNGLCQVSNKAVVALTDRVLLSVALHSLYTYRISDLKDNFLGKSRSPLIQIYMEDFFLLLL